jgi:hypothetical protein
VNETKRCRVTFTAASAHVSAVLQDGSSLEIELSREELIEKVFFSYALADVTQSTWPVRPLPLVTGSAPHAPQPGFEALVVLKLRFSPDEPRFHVYYDPEDDYDKQRSTFLCMHLSTRECVAAQRQLFEMAPIWRSKWKKMQ